MMERKTLSKNNNDVLEYAVDCLVNGKSVRIVVSGNSMLPLLKSGRDSVLLERCVWRDGDDVATGEPGGAAESDASCKRCSAIAMKNRVVLFKRNDGKFVLHRVVRVHEDSFDMRGDAQRTIEKGILKTQVVGIVTEFVRAGKVIKAGGVVEKMYLFVWRLLMPVRGKLVRCMMEK